MELVLDVLDDPWTPVPFNLPLDLWAVAANLRRRLLSSSRGAGSAGRSQHPEA